MKPAQTCHACAGSGLETDHRALGAEMRRRRKASGMSADRVGWRMRPRRSKQYVSALERGDRPWNKALIDAYMEALK